MRGWRLDDQRLGLMSVLVAAVLLATTVPAAAQEETAHEDVALAVPDASTLEAMCEANALDEDAERRCLYVVREIMLRTIGPEPDGAGAQPTEEPEPIVYGLGDAQDHDGIRIKPIKVRWDAQPLTSWDRPRKGMMFVDVFVQHKAGEEGGHYDGWNWRVRDRKGYTYDRHGHTKNRPSLLSGDLKPGRTVRGWVTFEVPRKTRWLEIRSEPMGHFATYFEDSDPRYWTVEKKKGR